jgi:thioredoxin 1
VVVLIVVGVVIAKHARKSSEPPEAAQVPHAAPEGGPAPPAAEGREPDETPVAGAMEAGSDASAGRPPDLNSEPPRIAHADHRSGPGAKAEGPLPGSNLSDCLASGLPTMADFGLGTCKACQAMEPILKQAAQDYQGRASIVFVELDKHPDLARDYRIAVMPTQIFFDADGKQVSSHMGYMDRAEIDRRLGAAGAKQ